MFNEENCLKPFIGLNIELKPKTGNQGQKNLGKILISSLSGNFVGNVRRRKE